MAAPSEMALALLRYLKDRDACVDASGESRAPLAE